MTAQSVFQFNPDLTKFNDSLVKFWRENNPRTKAEQDKVIEDWKAGRFLLFLQPSTAQRFTNARRKLLTPAGTKKQK